MCIIYIFGGIALTMALVVAIVFAINHLYVIKGRTVTRKDFVYNLLTLLKNTPEDFKSDTGYGSNRQLVYKAKTPAGRNSEKIILYKDYGGDYSLRSPKVNLSGFEAYLINRRAKAIIKSRLDDEMDSRLKRINLDILESK